jgi:hypothetical protein
MPHAAEVLDEVVVYKFSFELFCALTVSNDECSSFESKSINNTSNLFFTFPDE